MPRRRMRRSSRIRSSSHAEALGVKALFRCWWTVRSADRGHRMTAPCRWNREPKALFGGRAATRSARYVNAFSTPDTARRSPRDRSVLEGHVLPTSCGRERRARRAAPYLELTPLRAGEGGQTRSSSRRLDSPSASVDYAPHPFERSSDAHLCSTTPRHRLQRRDVRMLSSSARPRCSASVADLSPPRQPDGRLSIVVPRRCSRASRATVLSLEWTHSGRRHQFPWR